VTVELRKKSNSTFNLKNIELVSCLFAMF